MKDLFCKLLQNDQQQYNQFVSDYVNSIEQGLPPRAKARVVRIVQGSIVVITSIQLPDSQQAMAVLSQLTADGGNSVLENKPLLDQYGARKVDPQRVVSVVLAPPPPPPSPSPPPPPLSPGQVPRPSPPPEGPKPQIQVTVNMKFPNMPPSVLVRPAGCSIGPSAVHVPCRSPC